MSNAGKLVKSLVKTKKESVMGKLGDSPFDDPMEPWSAKYNAPVKNEETDSEKRIIDGYKKKYHPDEVKKQREINLQHQQQQQQMMGMQQMADAAGKVAPAAKVMQDMNVGGGQNALGALLGASQGGNQ